MWSVGYRADDLSLGLCQGVRPSSHYQSRCPLFPCTTRSTVKTWSTLARQKDLTTVQRPSLQRDGRFAESTSNQREVLSAVGGMGQRCFLQMRHRGQRRWKNGFPIFSNSCRYMWTPHRGQNMVSPLTLPFHENEQPIPSTTDHSGWRDAAVTPPRPKTVKTKNRIKLVEKR